MRPCPKRHRRRRINPIARYEVAEVAGEFSRFVHGHSQAARGVRGDPKPFSINKVILCSYQMCSIMKDEISVVGFDLVVVDEAHKLRNVHNSKSVTAQNVFYAINKYKKNTGGMNR